MLSANARIEEKINFNVFFIMKLFLNNCPCKCRKTHPNIPKYKKKLTIKSCPLYWTAFYEVFSRRLVVESYL